MTEDSQTFTPVSLSITQVRKSHKADSGKKSLGNVALTECCLEMKGSSEIGVKVISGCVPQSL